MDFINFDLIQLIVLVHSTIVNVYTKGTNIAATVSATALTTGMLYFSNCSLLQEFT